LYVPLLEKGHRFKKRHSKTMMFNKRFQILMCVFVLIGYLWQKEHKKRLIFKNPIIIKKNMLQFAVLCAKITIVTAQ